MGFTPSPAGDALCQAFKASRKLRGVITVSPRALQGREVRIARHEHVRTDCLGQHDEEVVVGIIGDGLVHIRWIIHDVCQLPDHRHEPTRVLDAQATPELRSGEHRQQLVEQQRRDDEAIPPGSRSEEEAGAHTFS